MRQILEKGSGREPEQPGSRGEKEVTLKVTEGFLEELEFPVDHKEIGRIWVGGEDRGWQSGGGNSNGKGGEPEKSLGAAESLQREPAREEVSLLEETGTSGSWGPGVGKTGSWWRY